MGAEANGSSRKKETRSPRDGGASRQPITDVRFAKVQRDPRFARFPEKARKVRVSPAATVGWGRH